jgi:hypothetical protein
LQRLGDASGVVFSRFPANEKIEESEARTSPLCS